MHRLHLAPALYTTSAHPYFGLLTQSKTSPARQGDGSSDKLSRLSF